MVFRALRKKPAPAVILDHAGCAMKHGLPDEIREWSLEGRKKRKRRTSDEEPDVNVQQCQHCFHIFRPGPDKCPSCGKPVERKSPRELRQVDGDLVKIDTDAIKRERKRNQGAARNLQDLIQLGVRRGMKNPGGWAVHVHCAREGRKPTASDYRQAKRLLAEVRAA